MFKKTLLSAAALLAAGTLSASVFAAPVTAEGTGVGKHGDITVAVTFDAGKIQDIKIVKNAENPILAKKVFTDLKDQVVALSSTDVDLVSGATFSAKGFIDAVNDAAKKAGVTLAKADKKALKKAARELPKTSNYDVVVIGAGGAGMAAAVTAHDLGAKVIVLEKNPQDAHISNTRMSGGIFHCPFKDGDPKALKEYAKAMFSGENIEWKEEGEIPEYSDGLAQVWADLSPSNLEFMQSLDPEFIGGSRATTRPASRTSLAPRNAATTLIVQLTRSV